MSPTILGRAHAATSPGPVNCNIRLRFQRLPYPQICERCRGGRLYEAKMCPFFKEDGTAKPKRKRRKEST